jgi:hypothetical protein
MRRVGLFSLVLVVAHLISASAAGARHEPSQSSASLVCDEAAIQADSYKLTTEAQAMNVLRPREPWWQPYGVWKEPREIGDLNQGALRLAERAAELDASNLLAQGYLARQYVVMAVDAKKAEAAWERVLDNGAAIVWTATLYDVDPRSFFVVAFDRRAVRIFRFGQLAGALRTHLGVPDFPGGDRVELWRALGGCLPSNAVPDAEVSWSDVREIRATKWTLRFELQDRITLTSDRGQKRTDDTLEINLHGQTGDIDFRFGMAPFGRRPFNAPPTGPEPAAYQQRALQMLVKFFDSQGRIAVDRGRSTAQ